MADATARSLQYEYKAVSRYLARNCRLLKIARVLLYKYKVILDSLVGILHGYWATWFAQMVCSSTYYSLFLGRRIGYLTARARQQAGIYSHPQNYDTRHKSTPAYIKVV